MRESCPLLCKEKGNLTVNCSQGSMGNDMSQKAEQYQKLIDELRHQGIEIVESDSNPDTKWGAYLRIAETSYSRFLECYWKGISVPSQDDVPGHQLSPKLLLIAPGMRLSLQYHNRRAEYWRVVGEPVRVIIGTNEKDLHEQVCQRGDVIHLSVGQWHRLIGMDSWGIVAEIWDSVDKEHPSDELDIVRISDDFGRK